MNSAGLIPLVAMLIPIIIVPIAIGCKLAHLRRKMEHVERMRALELGRVLPMDDPWWTPARISVAMGVVVPILAIALALQASMELGEAAAPVQVISGLIGTFGVLGGACLAARNMYYQDRMRNQSRVESASNKPAYDPDAFDVVGRRG